MKLVSFITALFITTAVMAQSREGEWDAVRATNETVNLGAGKRVYVKTVDFPAGTTELVYRISLLDDNQKMSTSLVSLLKAIPDPSGISQGAAGAVFLLSTISGDDKCTFAVFTEEADAIQYQKTGVAKNACFIQNEPVNKAARLFSENTQCVPTGVKRLYFGFQSENWVMKQKIVLEVVPWVDANLKKGWNTETKKEVIDWIKTLPVTQRLSQKDLFTGYFVGRVSQKYSYAEYKKLLPSERVTMATQLTEECLQKSGLRNEYLEAVRKEAIQLQAAGKMNEAMALMQKEIVDTQKAKDADYALLGSLCLFTKQFIKAEEWCLKAIALNPSEVAYQLQLAHIYMFTDRLKQARAIHEQYQQNHLSNYKSWAAQTKLDFEQFEKKGFDTRNFKKILRILE
ncbi:tetratricopeptide repeat protein [Flavobacterium sp.]|uniref:tetratricopeptide repeat protein n=1 Tax=Flavobacterium sp. TaxID=239 RepID=UPI002FDC956A